MNKPTGPLKVVLLGCGVVGSQVARVLLEHADELTERAGRALELVGIGVRTLKPRAGIPDELFTTDLESLVQTPGVDLVIELMGGLTPARELILAAVANGASVVSANKALLAEHGAEILAAVQEAGVDLYYEAAVAGAIPIIRPLRESLVGDSVTAVKGIVNGTTNYILDQMHTEGSTFAAALKEAQALGYAEADPTADVEGFDAAAKAALLASLAFHTRVTLSEVAVEGITQVTTSDIAAAEDMGCVIKLLANCALSDDGSIAVGVHPTMVPLSHPLATVKGAFNAIFVESREAGQLMFMGPGAGGSPTASAVMGDVVTAARNRLRGVSGPVEQVEPSRSITPAGQVRSRFYVALNVRDEPGVLARIAEVFARHDVSLLSVRQSPLDEDVTDRALLGLTTHTAAAASVADTVTELESMAEVAPGVRVMRVEGN